MKVTVFDNEGETFDRYTIVTEQGDVYGASDNPQAPNGFGQYSGTIGEDQFYAFWDTNHFVETARTKPTWLGKEISQEDLPNEIKRYIRQIEADEHGGENAIMYDELFQP